MRKKLLVGLMALTMVASMLAGCGDKKESDNTAKSTTEAVDEDDRKQAIKDYNELKATLNGEYSVLDKGTINDITWTLFSNGNVTDMSCMFRGCSNLTSIDLSNFDTSNVTDMYGMFDGCNESIVPDWY